MIYAALGLVVLASVGFGTFALIRNRELQSQVDQLQEAIQEQEERNSGELEDLRAELSRLEKIRHIPDIIERARRTKEEIAARLEQAQNMANDIILRATQEAGQLR